MNINQNNIHGQQENKLNKRQPLSFHAVELKRPHIVPSKYKKVNLKFLKRHARIYGIAKAALLYQIIGSLQHKKLYKGTQLIYVDYSKKVLSMMVEGLLSPYQAGEFLKQLHEEGVITLRKKHGYSIRGNRIHRGRNFMHDYTGMETGIFCIEDAKASSVNAAYLMTRVKQSCKKFNKKMKAGYLNPTTTYDIVSSDHIHDLCNGVLTEYQMRKARALLTKNNLLHKTRSRNKKFGKMTTNKWVYSTNIDALENYKTSKKANWCYTDEELYSYNELGMSLSTALTEKKLFNTSCTHNPKIDTHSNKLLSKSKVLDKSNTINHIDDLFITQENNGSYIDFNVYEKEVLDYEKNQQLKRRDKAIQQNISSKNLFKIDDYRVFPTKKQFFDVCFKENLSYAEAEGKWDYHENYWIQHGLPRNWVAVLISSIKRGKNKNLKSESKCRVYGTPVPAAFDVGGKSLIENTKGMFGEDDSPFQIQ